MARRRRKKESQTPEEGEKFWQWASSERANVFMNGFALFAFSLVTFLSLLSFADGNDRTNFMGLFGFVMATILHYLFGLGSYLVIAFVGWIGWRQLWDLPYSRLPQKSVLVGVMVISSCVLLNATAENWRAVGEWFDDGVYSQLIHPSVAPDVPENIRYCLGGAPLYYLYLDAPDLSLQRLLGEMGTWLLFSTLLLTSVLALAKVNPAVYVDKVGSWAKDQKEKGRFDIRHHFWQRPLSAIRRIVESRRKRVQSSEEGSIPLISHNTPIRELPEPEMKARPRVLAHDPLAEEEEPTLATPPARIPPTQPVAMQKPRAPEPRALPHTVTPAKDYRGYTKPGFNILSTPRRTDQTELHRGLRRQAEILEETLLSFGIEAKVGAIHCGPTITSFEVLPAVGVKVQKIIALENDIALNLKAHSIRIIAPIPGKAAVGIEVPNHHPQEVGFKEMLDSYRRLGKRFEIPILLGKTVHGECVMSDLTKMPHCIIAGATGSGKSVCINTIVMSILMNAKPDEIRLLMIDPKKVELTPYTNLPHMIAPVITEPQGACAALNWLVREMETRYEILKQVGARNFVAFNRRTRDKEFEESLEISIPEKMFYIVAIIDELADLMMISHSDIETPVARIAQMARAVGIHLILATQRPSREVITGLIKANFPTRICFKVASRINSQIVLDETGAETLLGNGDMLFLPPGSSMLVRCQGAMIRDEDINGVIDHICSQAHPDYLIKSFDEPEGFDLLHTHHVDDEPRDALYDQALQTIVDTGNASTTFLQRKLKIGYARAASIMDQLEENSVVGPADGSKPRKILVRTATTDQELFEEEME